MEQVGAAYVGKTSDSQLISSVGPVSFISAVLAGGSAVSYAQGQAMVDGGNGLKAKYTNGATVTDEVSRYW